MKLMSESFDIFMLMPDVLCSRQKRKQHLWRRSVVVITTAQLHLTKPELRFFAPSNPARSVSEILDGEDL